ncbi:MAG: GTP 3',8-cyclase MoaA [Nitrospirae bacterium]|nr:GTP 3',8-cyclase MoaA [Nitrospirota bacterium]MBE0428036.1 GTP 3',8-cyclase MoaA [Nitrospirota bacterium]
MLKDNFHRTIDYMRISVTDRCNLRCVYCVPSGGLKPLEHREILQYEEIVRILRIAVNTGVRKVRITGGEPLVRKNIAYLIRMIKRIEGIDELSMTTNGILLEKYAEELADAGLDRVNISLDSLKPERYREITRCGDIDAVLRGIDASEKAGLMPVKINMVPIRGLNDEEIAEFAKITLKSPYQVRFIEFMPFGKEDMWNKEHFISSEEIKSIVEQIGDLIPAKMRKSGPARYFRFDGAAGVVGFISPISNHFCKECNRLRLTADGKLRPCLFSETEIDLKPALRNNSSDTEIERLIELSIAVKPKSHSVKIENLLSPADCSAMNTVRNTHKRPMSQIGG